MTTRRNYAGISRGSEKRDEKLNDDLKLKGLPKINHFKTRSMYEQ